MRWIECADESLGALTAGHQPQQRQNTTNAIPRTQAGAGVCHRSFFGGGTNYYFWPTFAPLGAVSSSVGRTGCPPNRHISPILSKSLLQIKITSSAHTCHTDFFADLIVHLFAPRPRRSRHSNLSRITMTTFHNASPSLRPTTPTPIRRTRSTF